MHDCLQNIGENVSDWISNYELPQFSKFVMGQLHVLDAIQHLSSRTRRDIVNNLFQSMVCYTQ